MSNFRWGKGFYQIKLAWPHYSQNITLFNHPDYQRGGVVRCVTVELWSRILRWFKYQNKLKQLYWFKWNQVHSGHHIIANLIKYKRNWHLPPLLLKFYSIVWIKFCKKWWQMPILFIFTTVWVSILWLPHRLKKLSHLIIYCDTIKLNKSKWKQFRS
jgi:hypothetical protein